MEVDGLLVVAYGLVDCAVNFIVEVDVLLVVAYRVGVSGVDFNLEVAYGVLVCG